MEKLLLDYLKCTDEYSCYDDLKVEYYATEGSVCFVKIHIGYTDSNVKTYVNIWDVLLFVNNKIR